MLQAETEFVGLLRKVFARSTRIKVKKRFDGYSPAVVLLVENDSGLDLILKCAPRDPSGQPNVIEQEVVNYRDFIEGRLSLNHNVIYPELIRETRRVNGFATSFLGSSHRDRLTVKEYVVSSAAVPVVFATIRTVVSKVVDEVWPWWYRKEGTQQKSGLAKTFMDEGLPGDAGWNFSQGQQKLDADIHDAVRKIKGAPLAAGKEPSALLKEFKSLIHESHEPLTWEEAVTHGDLHGGNIFFEPDSMDIWLIDFARVGRRTSVFDLAAFEVNVKLQLLPLLLRHRRLDEDPFELVVAFRQVEGDLALQSAYSILRLPTIPPPGNAHYKAQFDALAETVRVVTHIRQLLNQSLGRQGSTIDYMITLYVLSYWYMGVRGPSDQESSSLQLVMAYESVLALHEAIKGLLEPMRH
jgi:hypothetical protein